MEAARRALGGKLEVCPGGIAKRSRFWVPVAGPVQGPGVDQGCPQTGKQGTPPPQEHGAASRGAADTSGAGGGLRTARALVPTPARLLLGGASWRLLSHQADGVLSSSVHSPLL